MNSDQPAIRSILMLGDSLTRGFDPSTDTYPPWTLYMLLAERYRTGGTAVLSAAGSGYNTRMMKAVMPEISSQCEDQNLKPALVTLWSGANDCILPTTGYLQHVPVPKYKNNLDDIIQIILSKWPSAKVLLSTPPPSIHEKWLEEMTAYWRNEGEEGPEPVQDRTLQHTKLYVDACKELAEGYDDVFLVDAWDIVTDAAGGTSPDVLAEYLPDGLHLNAKGHELVFNEVERVIRGFAGRLPAEGLEVDMPRPLTLPDWRDLARGLCIS